MTSGYLASDPLSGSSRLKWSGSTISLAYSFRESTGSQSETDNALLLLCLHGAYCNRGDFKGLFASAALRPYKLLAVDLPGHGESSKIPHGEPDAVFPAKMEEMADVVWMLLGVLGLQGNPTLVVAHSLGGTVGLLLAEMHLGHQLCSFVSLEGVLVATDTPEHGIANRWMKKDARQTCALDLLEDIAAARHLGRDSVGLDHWRDCADQCGESVHLLAIRISASMCSWARSGKLPSKLGCAPIFHYVYGTESGKFTEMLSSALFGRRNCRSHGIYGAGHFLLLENLKPTLGIIMGAIVESEDLAQKIRNISDAHLPAAKRLRIANVDV